MFVDVDELIQKAWNAVDKAGVPDPIQGVALKEAIDFLRDVGGEGGGEKPQKPARVNRSKAKKTSSSNNASEDGAAADPDGFFAQLANESGVAESNLRDVLMLKDGVVHVIPPTRKLGDSKADQSRQLIALVAGAYAHGLDRNPVDAVAVRGEAKRKKCFDGANFAAILKSMKGFNPGSHRNEIVVGSKWIGEFGDAVKTVTGDDEDGE
jgi:hypothetical protein